MFEEYEIVISELYSQVHVPVTCIFIGADAERPNTGTSRECDLDVARAGLQVRTYDA